MREREREREREGGGVWSVVMVPPLPPQMMPCWVVGVQVPVVSPLSPSQVLQIPQHTESISE